MSERGFFRSDDLMWWCRKPLLVLLVLSALCTPALGAAYGPDELPIRQAHLTVAAFTTEVEMTAAITYIHHLFSTDTSRLNALFLEFKQQEALIPQATTREDFEILAGQMRTTTAAFQNETGFQMTAGQGKQADLQRQIAAATTGNPHIAQRQQAYWNVRKTGQLRTFDAWVAAAQADLDTLKKQGFDTTTAQRTLDVIGSKRPVLVAALEAKNEDRIAAANDVIHPLTIQLNDQVQEAQKQVPEGERMQFLVDQGYRAVSRADQINNDAIRILLDIGPAEPALRSMKNNLATTRRLLASGNPGMAKTPFLLAKKDFKDLSMAYRDLANSSLLPPDLTATLRAMVITLDTTADQMELS
jgi:hypothetical protein